MGEINFGRNALRPLSCGVARPCSMLEMGANLVGFMLFNRARVSFALTHSEFRQNLKNLAALDF